MQIGFNNRTTVDLTQSHFFFWGGEYNSVGDASDMPCTFQFQVQEEIGEEMHFLFCLVYCEKYVFWDCTIP